MTKTATIQTSSKWKLTTKGKDCDDTDKTRTTNCRDEDDCNTSKEDLKKAFANISDTNAQKIADAINKYGKDFGIDTKEKLQHFMAQAGHESTNYAGIAFGAFTENLNYRWAKLGEEDYWKRYFNPSTNPTADPNKENPNDYKRASTSVYVDVEKFANHVYNDDNRSSRSKLGNSATGDGYKYRGRGIIQLTGKYNYQQFHNFYKDNYDATKDIVSNPDLLASDMEIAVISALWFFKKNVINKINIDDKTSIKSITKLVNGGDTGLRHRKELHTKAKANIDCI